MGSGVPEVGYSLLQRMEAFWSECLQLSIFLGQSSPSLQWEVLTVCAKRVLERKILARATVVAEGGP